MDNGSTDGSLELLEGFDLPAFRLIANLENLDFARGNNQGIAQAQGRYLVTLNNDTDADESWLEELIRVAESAESVGMVASRIALFDQRSHLDSAGMAIYPDLLAKQRGRLGPFDGFPTVEEARLPWPMLLLSPAYTFLRYAYQGYGALAGRGSSGRIIE